MKPKTKVMSRVGPAALVSSTVEDQEADDKSENRIDESSKDYTRILLVDDHPVVRKGLLSCFHGRAGLIVVGEAADGLEALRKVGELAPDVVLMDVEMPRMDGLSATELISNKFPETKVLVISAHDNPEYVVRAIQMGARGFTLKSSSSEEIIKAIEIVQRGEPFFYGQYRPSAPGQISTECPPKEVDGLFKREKEVLVQLAAGYTNREIAELLNTSVRTVETHRARVMKKLNIHTIAGLTRYALAHGLISLNPAFSVPAAADDGLRFPLPPGLRV